MLGSGREYEDRLIRDAYDSEGVFMIPYTSLTSEKTRCINFVPAVQESSYS